MNPMSQRACVFILTIWVSAVMCETLVSYNGYSLIHITPSESQMQSLLKRSSSGSDFWQASYDGKNHSATVMLSPATETAFLQELKEKKIPYHYLLRDVGRTIQEDAESQSDIPSGGMDSLFAQYNSVDQISAIITFLAESYPNHVALKVYGHSFEGRPLQLLKISTRSIKPKEAIWIQGGVHACEHIGPAVVLYIAMKLAIGFEESAEVFTLVNAFDWYIAPLANPDGYRYSQTVDRFWRKTRSYNPKSPKCIGVDLNRNWNWDWNNPAGSSSDPCSITYAGPSAFSESESRSIADLVTRRLRGRFLLFLDVHNFSQRWLTPWGYTTQLPPDYQQQKELAEVAVSALEAVYGTKYTVGSTANALYIVSGGARDYMYGAAGATYSYTVELRDTGHYGFLLPKDQILPTAVETWAGLKALALDLLRP